MGPTRIVVAGSEETGFVPGIDPPLHLVKTSVSNLGTREELEAEIDQILSIIRGFWEKEPDEVMREISAWSARASELAVHLHRVEGSLRYYKQIRTMQIQPILIELERQFKLASRLIEVRRQDMETIR
jgi:hypothetical protein